MLFFFNDTATTEIYTLSLHDALPICLGHAPVDGHVRRRCAGVAERAVGGRRSEEHTSELQSHVNLVCRLLLEKKKKRRATNTPSARLPTKGVYTQLTDTKSHNHQDYY